MSKYSFSCNIVQYFDLIQENLLKRPESEGMFSSITRILRNSDLNPARSGKKKKTTVIKWKGTGMRGYKNWDLLLQETVWEREERKAVETKRGRNHVRQDAQERRPETILDEGLSIHLSSLWPLLTQEESCRSVPHAIYKLIFKVFAHNYLTK